MYQCHIHFYFTGSRCRAFDIIKEMPPLEHFFHEFMESEKTEKILAEKADVIFANIQGMDAKKEVQTLLLSKSEKAELILLADKEQILFLVDELAEIKDIWTFPMSEEEISFRFLRWQQDCKRDKDYWQTSQYLEATINSVPNLIWYKDKNGIHEKVNDSFCHAVEKTKEQVQGRGHAYIWDVERDDPACIESEHEVMTKKKTFVSEETIKTKDGRKLLTTYKSPLYDIDGSVMGTVGVAIDITQERAYEQEIMDKNRTLETIFTSMECGVLCHTIDGTRIISINRAALKILGYDSLEELQEDGFDMVAASVLDEDKPRLRESIRELTKIGDTVSTEYRVQYKNGQICHIMGNIKLIEENGNPIYQRFLLDCTAQKLQEERNQRRQMELVQALCMDYNLVCFFELNTGWGDTLRSDGNRMFDSVFSGQILLDQSMETYIQQYVYEEDREMLRQASSLERINQKLEGKKQFSINYRALWEGEIQYFQMKVVKAGTWDGSHGIVLGFHNVDEEIRNEMKQKNSLEDALSQARNASKAKSVFLSNMSHDIRTPMNAIVGFTSLAISHIDRPDQVEEYLKKIMASGNHLLSLINDVLDMSRIESGKMQIEEKPCSLLEILCELNNMVQADVRAKQLKLNIDTTGIVNENVYCDKLRLNQVLLNLLGNAVKYTNAGGVIDMRVTEKTEAMAEYTNYEFCIRDTGIGMSEEFVKHIFEPFERERNSTISGIQGTGLGMAITKNIVNMMNGTISVKSKQGVGSEFTVSFYFRLCAEQRERQPGDICANLEQAEKNKKMEEKTPEKLRSGRILLAEDIELNQEIAVAILEEAGFQTEVAGNGRIAVDMLAKSEPGYYQVVLMDVQMPVMGGYDATREIRKLENKELASIPILAMTANAFEEDKKEALKCGMNGHIAKPIDIESLFAALDKVIE